jgi:HAD superfamily hydrolase (TIGR01549 family)
VGARAHRTGPPRTGKLPPLVLFDLDDTIFDHSMTCRAALVALRQEQPFLRRTPIDEQWRTYAELLSSTHVRVMLGSRSIEDARRERFERLAKRAGRSVSKVEAEALSQSYRAHYQRLRRPVPGAPEFLRQLRGRARIGIVSNNTRAEQTEKLAFLGLGEVVDDLVTSAELGIAKPDPAIFRVALEHAGAGPSDAVMVGDVWESDVLGARAAGIRPVWFNRFRIPRPARWAVDEFASFRPPRRLDRLLAASSGGRPTA